MKVKIFLTVMLAASFIILQVIRCEAGAAVDLVRALLEEVMTIQTDPHLQGHELRNTRRVAIKKIIMQNFYFDSMAKEALGKYWEELSGPKRAEFEAIFKDLFQESYSRLVLDFLGREKILYTKEEIGQDQAMVKTTIMRVNEEIPVDYFLMPVEDKWLVYDVKIDGVSIVENYRKSFARVIRQESYESLLRKMRLQQQAIERPS
jgi:phospholipid transport system substrate-binding protein